MLDNAYKETLSSDDLEQVVAGTMPPITVDGKLGWDNHSGWGGSVRIVVDV